MQSSTLRAARFRAPLFCALAGAAALVACSEQPAAPRETPIPAHTLQALDCTARVSGSVSCAPVTPGTGTAQGVMYGGQNMFVTLSASNFNYNPGTEEFTFDVTVQNLLNESIGTPDGVTAAANGIMVFFYDEPVGMGGSPVSVMEATGTAFFTSANQPYYTYNEVLDKDEVSAGKQWKFHVPLGEDGFSFRVLIETEVQYKLVINEVLVNPANAASPTVTDATGEWFEIYNAGTRSVDLQDLVIADSAASGRRPYHLISSSVVVQPGGYVVLGNTTNTTTNGGVPVDYAYGSALSLVNSLDAVKIARVVGTDTLTLDRTQYASAAISAKDGVGRELKNPALDNSNMDGSNWDDAAVTAVYGPGGRGTPRAQNSVYTP